LVTSVTLVTENVGPDDCSQDCFTLTPHKDNHSIVLFTMAEDLVAKHPMVLLRQGDQSKEEWIEYYTQFLVNCGQQEPNCLRRTSNLKTALKCSCLTVFLNQEVAKSTALFCHNYGSQDRITRLTRLGDWIRYSNPDQRTPLPFMLPTAIPDPPPPAETQQLMRTTMICQSALMRILGIGKRAWHTAKIAAVTGAVPDHGLKGRTGQESNKSQELDALVKEDVIEYLQDLADAYGEPRATVVVRTLTGAELRNEDTNVLELPPFLSRRKIYARFCYSRGWIVKIDHKGKVVMEQRSDDAWDDDLEMPVGSFTTFNSIWKAEFPTLQIRTPVEDICGDCYRFSQMHKVRRVSYKKDPFCLPCPYKDQETEEVDASEDEEDADSMVVDSSGNEEALDKALRRREKEYAKIGLHVREAANMRTLANEARARCREDAVNNKPVDQRTITLVADFSQNMELPLFGAEQPGETYYYTPLTVNAFGIVDTSTEPEHLHFYLYEEFVGRKGGNNVASLLIHHLHQRGLMTRSKRKLVVIMDNCAGQNKNKMVLRIAPYLMERKFFYSVKFHFLIAGHTKNSADRLFNQAKATYRKSNIYSMGMLEDAVKSCGKGNITTHRVDKSIMRNWDAHFDRLYRNFNRVKTTKWQIFECERGTSMTLSTSGLPEAEKVVHDTLKRADGDRATILEEQPAQLVPPGLKEIKQVELYKKYRPLIPEKYRDELCPEPEEGVIKRVKEHRNETSRKRKDAKIRAQEAVKQV